MVRLFSIACLLLVGASGAPLPKAVAVRTPAQAAAAVPAPLPEPPRVATSTIQPRAIERAPDGLFYVEATVNGASIHFVVDSGASVIVLSAADAARASVDAQDGVSVDTAGGSAAMRRTQIRQIVLAGRTLSNVDAAVGDRNLPVSLLGQSALSQLDSVVFKGDRLTFD